MKNEILEDISDDKTEDTITSNEDKKTYDRWVSLATSRLSRLHSTEIIKKDRKVIEEYDGSGRIHIPSIPLLFKKQKIIMLPQKKRKGNLKDKPDLIILFDVSGSIDGSNLKNKLRVLCSSIGRIFLADLNQIHLITIGYGSKYFAFNKFVELDKWLREEEFRDGNTDYISAFNCLNQTGILNTDRPRLIVMITDGCPNEIATSMKDKLEKQLKHKNWWEENNKFKVGISKDYLLKIINHILTLSKLRDTIYKTIVIANIDHEDTKEANIRINENWRNAKKEDLVESLVVSGSPKNIAEAVAGKFITEFFLNSINLSTEEFKTGDAYHIIVDSLKKEIFKFELRR